MSKNPKRVVTPMFRASYAHVFKATAMEGSDEKNYSISMIFPKSTDLKPIKAAIQAAIKEKWGDKKPKGLRLPFRDGDEEREEDEAYAESIFINCKSKNKPGIIDRDRNDILDESEFYSGCYARATVTAYAWDNKFGKGVSLGLDNLQKLKDGEPLGGRAPDAADDFEDDLDDLDLGDDSDEFDL